VNLEQITGYDSEYRRAITRWGSRTEPSVEQVRFLLRSRIVAMGVTVSNLSARGIFKATAKRSEFEEALETAVRRTGSPAHPRG
jgi:hypothetical protein